MYVQKMYVCSNCSIMVYICRSHDQCPNIIDLGEWKTSYVSFWILKLTKKKLGRDYQWNIITIQKT